jgi:23S rRNA (uracil1939-C5)-methyltransferase
MASCLFPMFWLRKQLLLAPSLANALLIARAVGETLASSQKPLDILVTATASGLDVDVKGNGALDDQQRLALVRAALKHDLARLSNHGEVLTQRMPLIAMGKAVVAPPPGAFLQATEAGEEVLATRVFAQIAGVKRIADLFCGIGTFDPWVILAPSDSWRRCRGKFVRGIRNGERDRR